MHTYIARELERLPATPEAKWGIIRVGVFRVEDGQETQVGEYLRRFLGITQTFHPFRLNDRDYALYSPSVDTTRVMELPSCKDIGAGAASPWGFVVLEYFVPTYVLVEQTSASGQIWQQHNNPEPGKFPPDTPLLYYPFAFVAGRMWAEQEPNLLQFIDLSRLDQGIISQDDRFGRVFVSEKIPLKDSIDMDRYLWDNSGEEDDEDIDIQRIQRFNVRTGKLIDT